LCRSTLVTLVVDDGVGDDGVGDDGAGVGRCAHPHVSPWFPSSCFLISTFPDCGSPHLRYSSSPLPHHGNVFCCHGGAIHKRHYHGFWRPDGGVADLDL